MHPSSTLSPTARFFLQATAEALCWLATVHPWLSFLPAHLLSTHSLPGRLPKRPVLPPDPKRAGRRAPPCPWLSSASLPARPPPSGDNQTSDPVPESSPQSALRLPQDTPRPLPSSLLHGPRSLTVSNVGDEHGQAPHPVSLGNGRHGCGGGSGPRRCSVPLRARTWPSSTEPTRTDSIGRLSRPSRIAFIIYWTAASPLRRIPLPID